MKVAIIGGGAAGFFAALSVAEHHPKASISILEKSPKLLSKVKVSGGGRCNVTNGTESIKDLWKAYPRGGRALKKLFPIFNTKHTYEWFESRGVPLMIQEDNCVFPVSQDSQSIIDCFLDQAKKSKIDIRTRCGVERIREVENFQIALSISKGEEEIFDKVIIATGGSPKRKGLEWLEELGHKIENPVPSLFTFNMPSESIRSLMGVVVEETITTIQGTALKSDGPLLITHWGMSGPSILKLSAFGARMLSEMNYEFNVQVNWVNEVNNEVVKQELQSVLKDHGKKLLTNYRPYGLPDRLWQYLLVKSELPADRIWSDIGKKGMNKLVTLLTNDVYEVKGKTTFKEEFVTCGGVSLESINMKTMESKVVKNLYFSGEVMDIDAITGGYNFQGAWTTGYVAGMLK
ncbi:BaiN/RdsA family NAD(P)/FAD-dependent oxidoreductase [Portibacter lacus]|uniref:Flavoprotein n=1 Tax=Portibacter lacus TaxID=1099794 RepID=A0AA37SJZ5_9BACT|nr:NAD(P)/FAD-dependent oxidoreductase [Portibacter lacus]GLR16036.1 flavoprotein [Portibacter lacus]